ncbi:YdeI/OmpD-associated family protein [Labrys sp. La1]|uniref:YdeI/OmpD-associated family protein n=1 Tax=Labrys sp. La1 TaxID=3404917 RepID=UPI003EBAD967
MAKKTFKTKIVRDGSACFIPLDFDPKPVFGKVRAPVKVTLNGYTYRSTIASMGGQICIPLRKSNREAAGLEGGETLDVELELDVGERTIEIPPDLEKALRPSGRKAWAALSYTRRREYAEAVTGAKKADTRARRVEQISHELNSSPTS